MDTVATVLAPAQAQVDQTIIKLVEGDLTALAVDAIVFYAREDLQLGSGFGTAIQVRGGDAVKKELEQLGSVRMGQAVLTGGGKLKARHIIHTCGPKFQEADAETRLRQAIEAALTLANTNGLKRIALPPLGAGFYGVPLDLCARVTVEILETFLENDTSLEEVTICARDRREFSAFAGKVAEL